MGAKSYKSPRFGLEKAKEMRGPNALEEIAIGGDRGKRTRILVRVCPFVIHANETLRAI